MVIQIGLALVFVAGIVHGFRQPPGVAAGTLLPAGSPDPKSWHATLEQIEQADWALSASRYKPQVTQAISQETPAALITDIRTLETDLLNGLSALEKELNK